MINNVTLIGRLTRDMDLSYLSTGTAKGSLSLAVNENTKAGEHTSFFDVVLWGKTAESLQRYLTKGKQIGVVGKIKQERWEKDGQNRSKVVIYAHVVQLLGGQAESKSQASYSQPDTEPEPFEDDMSDIPF